MMGEHSTLELFLEKRELDRGLVMQKLEIIICSCCGHWATGDGTGKYLGEITKKL